MMRFGFFWWGLVGLWEFWGCKGTGSLPGSRIVSVQLFHFLYPKFSGCCLQIVSAERSHYFKKCKCSASVFSE